MALDGMDKDDYKEWGLMKGAIEQHGVAIAGLREDTREIKDDVKIIASSQAMMRETLNRALEIPPDGPPVVGPRVKSYAKIGAIGAGGSVGVIGLIYAALYYGAKIVEVIFGGP